MAGGKRPIIGLKKDDLVPPDEDRLVEVGVYDALLPCRIFKVDYKVAVLGHVSPSLEFLLRLVKVAPGISEEDAAGFFGYAPGELGYVLDEGTGPGYLERTDGRLWLKEAGEDLFRDGQDGPLIFSVEIRTARFGFDLLAVAPQRRQPLDEVERFLPELPVEEAARTGSVSAHIPDRVGRFFHELGDRRDREQAQRRDLYSVDDVAAETRFQVPVRIHALARASSPSLAESDLRSWRSDQELADRPQVERAAGVFVNELRMSREPQRDPLAYEALVGFAPDFLKDFATREGLAVNRFWREAVGRAGEARSDRPTIPMVGPLFTQANAERLEHLLGYGLRAARGGGKAVLWIAPQVRHWGATTQLRECLALARRRLQAIASGTEDPGVGAHCIVVAQPPRHIERSFDAVHGIDAHAFPARLELLLIPGVAAAALVHAPIGAFSGLPVPLGIASFDEGVVARITSYLGDRIPSHLTDPSKGEALEALLRGTGPTEPAATWAPRDGDAGQAGLPTLDTSEGSRS